MDDSAAAAAADGGDRHHCDGANKVLVVQSVDPRRSHEEAVARRGLPGQLVAAVVRNQFGIRVVVAAVVVVAVVDVAESCHDAMAEKWVTPMDLP